ncbi:MAG: DUF899 domain-containing protein [Armatimonadetes bacterium]|nr:DUF899 domain-containing protein [Armatimonadota bacterium]
MNETMPDLDGEIARLEQSLVETRAKLAELRRKRPAEAVKDYTLVGWDGGPLHLWELFGEKKDLIVVHNMGSMCPYCTMWADGFNGIVHHLESRAAFVVVSPDAPDTQRKFAESRGWKFRMASSRGSTFTQDMGYETVDGKKLPGASIFHQPHDGGVQRVARASFGPRDEYCSAWHFFDLLDGGAKEWEPHFRYGS